MRAQELWREWRRRVGRRAGSRSRDRRHRSESWLAEVLEERTLLSTITVTTHLEQEAGKISLREAIAMANEASGLDTIVFDPALSGQTFTLTLGQLEVTDSIVIRGLGASRTIIDAQQQSRVFDVTDSVGDATFDGLTITGGYSHGILEHGGGIRSLAQHSLTVTNCAVTGNLADYYYSRGGGISATNGTVTISNTLISGNSADGPWSGGAGLSLNGCVATFTNCTISGNTINAWEGSGAGIEAYDATLTLTNCTVTQNVAQGTYRGTGGILVSGSLSLVNCIVAGNFAGGNNVDLDSSILTVRSSLIGSNAETQLAAAPVGSPDAHGNIIGTKAQPIDPQLGPLADNGGQTMTRRPLSGSPVIDAGQATSLTTDQRGGPFVREFGGKVDLGAVELQSLNLVVTTVDDELDATFDPADLSLREALALVNGLAGADTISFAPALRGATFGLTLGQLTISDSVTITGLGSSQTIISGQSQSRVFDVVSAAGDVQIEGLTITGGRTTAGVDHGAGIRNRTSGRLTLKNVTLSGNSTLGLGALGGGLASFDAGDVSLSGTTVSGNFTAGQASGGGGIYLTDGNLFLENSTVSGNATVGIVSSGGGIVIVNGTATLISSTVAGNQAAGSSSGGGGILSDGGNIVLLNTIVADNTSTSIDGPDMLFVGSTPGTVSALHSLIGNGAGSGLAAAPVGVPDANGNLVGTSAAPIDPRLGPLADNGGSTRTRALLPDSPALNGGKVFPLDFDQRGTGFSRVVHGKTDIGAFQHQLADSSTPVNFQATEGGVFTGVVLMTFVSGNPNAVAGDFSVTVDWGLSVLQPTITLLRVSVSQSESVWQVLGQGTSPIGGSAGLPAAIEVAVEDAFGSQASTSKTTIEVVPASPPARQLVRQTGLAGLYYSNGQIAEVLQNGTQVTLIDAAGKKTIAGLSNGTELAVPDWGTTAEFDPDAGSVAFSDGSVWTKVRQIAGQWLTRSGRVAGIRQVGTKLTFTGGTGERASGMFVTANQLVATGWGNLVGVLSSDGQRIDWSNGTVWELISDFAGDWSSQGGAPTYIEQLGATLRFVNRHGETSIGRMLTATQVVTGTNWGAIVGQIVGNTIQFANGTTWSIPLASSELPALGGLWQSSHASGATRVLMAGATLTFVNRTGGTSAGEFISDTQVRAIDWDQLGTVVGNQILWQNGTVWTQIPKVAGSYINQGNAETGINQYGRELTFTDQFGHVTHGTFLDATHLVEVDGLQRSATLSGTTITWSNGPIWNKLPALSGNWSALPSLSGATYVEQSGVELFLVDDRGTRFRGRFTDVSTLEVTETGVPNPSRIAATLPVSERIAFDDGLEWRRFPPHLLDNVFAGDSFWPFA